MKKLTMRLWALFALPMLLAWLLPERAAATHVDDTWKYQVSLNGSNTISIQAPVYDQEGADCWVCDGNLKATWTDDSGKSQTKTVFHWQRNGDTDSSSKDIWIHFKTDVGGSIDVTQGNTSNHFTLTSADGDIQRLVYRNNDGNTYTVYAVWRLPYDMLGKDGKSRSVKFTWDVQRDGNSRSKEKVSGLSDVTISVPAAQGVVNPQVTMASMAYSEVGKLEVPWFIASTSLTAARYEYINANGQKVQQQLPTNANSGTIYLDATEPHDNFRVVVSYKDNSNYSIDNVSSETQNLKMIHAPVGFTATPTGDSKASVRLAWSIQHPNADDLSEMDFFEVQRSLTGEEADFVTIGSEPFMLSAEELNYTYIDSTIIDAVTEAQLTGGGTLSKLTYRVRRMITQNWGWDGNNCTASASCVVADIHLLRISTYSARWEDEQAYSVRVAWDYADEPNAVWDNRAKLMLRITSTNRTGGVVETQEVELNAAERQQRYKVVNLTRPCVDYKIEVYVDRGTSPIHLWEELTPYYFPIRTAADWNTFRQKVINAKGQYDVSARLYADITVNQTCGDSNSPFRGRFDGNGHTLNLNIDNVTVEYQAPFRYAKDYTIENLRTTGSVNGFFYCSGLVGTSYSSTGKRNTIRNCRVSATVQSNRDNAGGIIGHGNKANHDIDNCLFDGKLISKSGNYGGAIIGWEDGGTDNCVTNCLENGSYEGFSNTNLCFANGNAYNNVGNNTNNWSMHGWGNDARGKTTDELLAALGSGWQKEGDAVVPVMTQFAEPTAAYPTPTLPTFHHESIGKVEKTLVTQTRQSSVVITWDTDGNPIDYFQVLRRVKGGTNWEVIADQLDQTSYEDITVSPLMDYEYMVRGANDCEGMSYSETDIAQGACKHTGRVTGYVRMKDGTGVQGIDVNVKAPTGETTTAKTDETGYFVADELSYFGQPSITYTVTPVSGNAIRLEVESYAVTFNNESNDQTLREFVITNSHRFTGYVMYDGTSIPVKGARFRVNGQPLHNNKGGYVETDFDGSFSFNVLDGKNVIQAVMDGHTFTADGYFKSKDGHVFTDDVAQIYFYDDTKVKLTGRVVGGNDQGRLPLDNNLSRNNLGDDLTMVFTLEGDNTSWLVYDNQNPERTERDTTFTHTGGQHSTQVQTQRKRMVVKPDAVTGEYVLKLPPVRWKVQQVYCKGYPTLFQDGQVSEVVDLTDCRDTVYSRIYHAPVEITYRQANYETFDYFGDKTYTASTVGGDKVTVPLVCEGDASLSDATRSGSNTVAYTFGYPVFSLGRKYPIELQVGERYLYNNDTRTGQVDIVSVGGGQVTVRNGMRSGLQQEVVTLDSLGQGRFYLLADQTTRLLTGEDALKTVTLTLTQDGTTYEAKPLQGYVLNMFATSGAKDVISAGEPVLIDVLRDPPGGSSTATLSKGSKLKLSYTVDMKFKAGLDITFGTGTSLNNYSGLVAGTAEYGLINSATTTNYIDLAVIFSGAGKKAYSYTMTVGEDITTSGAATMVGAEADLYIGVVQNMIVTPVSTIRAIPDSLFQHMTERLSGDALPTGNAVKYGTLVEIAKGQDAEGNIYHLVRDESLAYGPQLESQFIHSQKHIVSEILPKLANEINALLFTGTLAEAQAQANQTGQPVYLVTKTAEGSGLVEDYQQVLPAGSTGLTDEVAQKLKILKAWVDMIAMNEMEKLNAHDLVANYDVDGGTKVSYSEAFETEYSVSQYINYPFTQADYFGSDGVDGRDVTLAIANTLLSQPALASLFKLLSKAISPGGTSAGENPQQGKLGDESLELNFAGTKFNFGIKPVAEYSSTGTYGTQHNYSRKESFNLSMDPKSHLSVDVYRAHTLTTDSQSGDTGNFDVFRNDNFDDWVDAVNNHINDGVDYSQVIYPHNFVYRTRGGATHAPWEDARYTVAYQPGTPLDERTKKICNPVITLDRQSVSGVAMGEPARFKMYITNESEWPEAATGGLTMYTLFMDGEHNPNGAKLSVDGSPLNGNGMSIVLYPGKVLEKTLEVYAGSEFDYEGLVVGVASSSDWINTQCKVAFDVHYLHEAGPVFIASPGDKWVMNTNAQYDAERGWFLPVTIEGFDKHQPNFDHIEFQYKESLRGEDAWTNLCSYYADSLLMADASGVKEMIPENGNITNRFYGEGTVMEKAYDLRAVLYCRNGNSFLTTASPIVSGVKDTRRPQLFGTPEPINSILTMGQNIVFNFSEDIEYNYLNAVTNFEVKGEVNNQNVTETVSLQFSGNSSVESEAQRNFSGKDLTIDLMIRPDETGRDMPLFSHGTNGKKLQLWLTSDFRLKAVVDEQEFVSDSTIVKGGFTQVAMAIETNGTLTFYNGGKIIGTFTLAEPYNGTGALIFGRTNEADRTQSTFYNGRMMEARLWYRALDGGQVGTTYGSRRLTGYEMGLVDYYPMNEGSGNYATDQTQGANARLINASWAMPRGLSLHMDRDDKGIALTQNALNRTAEQDYTLMFWFKTDTEGRGVLLSNGAGSKTEINAANQFNIAFEAEKLMYRSNGHAYDLGNTYSDNQWHHLAMTVNRAYNVANIYVDQALKATFSPDSLGGISGGHPMIGGGLRGNIDELMFFGQALPLQLIKTYATKSPQGDEAGLLTYLSFDRQERQKDNDIVLVAYPYSKKIYLDNNGNPRYELDPVTQEPTSTLMRDYVFADSVGEILAHITGETAAPVVPYEELKNLTFSFVGKDNQLLVGINEPDARINRRNIYVTVRDVEDKNGNAMASPQTACYYVTNSALSWLIKQETITAQYGYDNTQFSLLICNNGATSHTYTIENCPKWLTLSTYTDVIAPQEYVTIAARVSKDLNVGSYDEILYLTDENGISEPFYLNLTVEGEQPVWAWSVGSDLLQYSMNIVGRVFVNDEIDIDNRDIVGVFGQDGQCHGFAHVSYSTLTGESNLYLTAYDNQASGRDLYFKLWQYSTGRELQLTANGGSTLTFQNNTVVGTDTPVRFEGGNLYVQTFDLKEGWNWVSFNVASERLFNLNNLLDGLPWKEGDVLTDMNSDLTLVYTAGHWLASENPENIVLSPRKAYAIKVQEDIKFPVAGSLIKADDARTIDLKQGWNGIGYTPILNLPIETALSDYYDKAEPGDVIKSHNEFAYFTVSGGTGRWRGSLEYMKPGEGYMLLRKGATATSFRYPFYEPGSTFIDEWSYSTSRSAAPAHARSTMTVSATVDGVELEEGDRLLAFADGECVGESRVLSGWSAENSEPLYLSIAGDKQQGLWFAIERDGDIIAATSELMTFTANAVIGSPEEPTKISFVKTDREDGKWYNVSGIQLPKRPTQSGVYIFNGKKIVIK
ncbi:MAG: hypothetical protein IJP70_03105 [Bacteroidales bacterium]|nr:hypothetical protein [Bacteroidales bacterium]